MSTTPIQFVTEAMLLTLMLCVNSPINTHSGNANADARCERTLSHRVSYQSLLTAIGLQRDSAHIAKPVYPHALNRMLGLLLPQRKPGN